jgi:hypothetical protein
MCVMRREIRYMYSKVPDISQQLSEFYVCNVFVTALDNKRLWTNLLSGSGVCEIILLVQFRL